MDQSNQKNPTSETSTVSPSPKALHQSFEKLAADFADANPYKPISLTTIRELGLWSEKRSLLRTREAMLSDGLYAAIVITADGRAELLEHDPSQSFDIRANLDGVVVLARDSVHRPAPAPSEPSDMQAECGPAVASAAIDPSQAVGVDGHPYSNERPFEVAAFVVAVMPNGKLIATKSRGDRFANGSIISPEEMLETIGNLRGYPFPRKLVL